MEEGNSRGYRKKTETLQVATRLVTKFKVMVPIHINIYTYTHMDKYIRTLVSAVY